MFNYKTTTYYQYQFYIPVSCCTARVPSQKIGEGGLSTSSIRFILEVPLDSDGLSLQLMKSSWDLQTVNVL